MPACIPLACARVVPLSVPPPRHALSRLRRYYLSGSDAYRLKLLLQSPAVAGAREELEAAEQLQQLGLGEQAPEGQGQGQQGEAAPARLAEQRRHGEHDHQAAA